MKIIFEENVKELQKDLNIMCDGVAEQINSSIKALINKDMDLARKVIFKDDLIDKMEKDIENKAIKLIATKQPLATDLRNIFTISKIVTDLERIADHAVSIARITLKIKNHEFNEKGLQSIEEIKNIIISMLKESIMSYIEGDADKAYETCKLDDEVDGIYKHFVDHTLGLMIEHKENVEDGSNLLFVGKFLERIGDHITNICEWTIYLVTGKQVDLNE